MPSSTDFPARGKVIRVEDSAVIFLPANSNYELKLATAGRYDGPVDTMIEAFIQANARKLWTVPSGGNFIAPIFGPPRIVQGRIKYLDQTTMVVQAGAPVRITLPSAESAFDLKHRRADRRITREYNRAARRDVPVGDGRCWEINRSMGVPPMPFLNTRITGETPVLRIV